MKGSKSVGYVLVAFGVLMLVLFFVHWSVVGEPLAAVAASAATCFAIGSMLLSRDRKGNGG